MSELTSYERKLSSDASHRLPFRVQVYCDGHWICEPYSAKFKNGYGSTPAEAEADCLKENVQNIK